MEQEIYITLRFNLVTGKANPKDPPFFKIPTFSGIKCYVFLILIFQKFFSK